MRRFFFAAAIMAIVGGGPLQAQGGDREIAQQIIDKLKVHRDAGSLKDFTLDLKVDQGVVLLRGSVGQAEQKANVLAAANGIDGITRVVDEIEVRAAQPAAGPSAIVRPKAMVAEVAPMPNGHPMAAQAHAATESQGNDRFSFKDALAAAGPTLQRPRAGLPAVSTAADFAAGDRVGAVQRVANTEAGSAQEADAQITAAVVAALGSAQRQGRLKNFGVDVNTRDGKVLLNGRASSQEQRRLISDLVRQTPGVVDVMEDIAVIQPPAPQAGGQQLQPLPAPAGQQGGTPAMVASARNPVGVPAQQVSVPMQAAPYCPDPAMAVQPMQGGYSGMPVPMGPYAGVGAGPRYEQPYLPNYAWPGYAAYPNYAAVSYPQQYSPSAFPYIGPFYPYPQVPLGWRKVCLEWDDGWWFLDFTDR
jgi:osmotically-inducible protein OsmY